MATTLSEHDWQIRLFIYQVFAARALPPLVSETADHFGMSDENAAAAYRRLHDAHTLFLTPGTSEVRMANPLSAVETSFRVTVNGQRLFANCAWDSLGIPAMLAADATIEAAYTDADATNDPAQYALMGGVLSGDDGIVHFPLPFRQWYDNLVHT